MAGYEVTNVSEDNSPDPNGSGDYVDVYDVVFTIAGRPGTFTVQVPLGGNTVQDAYDAITAKVAQVNAIYGGATGAAAE